MYQPGKEPIENVWSWPGEPDLVCDIQANNVVSQRLAEKVESHLSVLMKMVLQHQRWSAASESPSFHTGFFCIATKRKLIGNWMTEAEWAVFFFNGGWRDDISSAIHPVDWGSHIKEHQGTSRNIHISSVWSVRPWQASQHAKRVSRAYRQTGNVWHRKKEPLVVRLSTAMATKQRSPPPPLFFFFVLSLRRSTLGVYTVTSVQESLLTHLKGFGTPLLKWRH